MTTISIADFDLSPDIVVARGDHQQLTVLALAGLGHSTEDADGLLYELERAHVVADDAVPEDVVRMGALVRYRSNGGTEREVSLVYPAEADIGSGRISVLTPIGTALLGLRKGQSITWETRDGRKQVLTVLAVSAPGGDDDGGPTAA